MSYYGTVEGFREKIPSEMEVALRYTLLTLLTLFTLFILLKLLYTAQKVGWMSEWTGLDMSGYPLDCYDY